MHFLHVRFQRVPLSISFAAKFALELVGRVFTIDTVNPLNMLVQPELGCIAVLTLLTLELAFVISDFVFPCFQLKAKAIYSNFWLVLIIYVLNLLKRIYNHLVILHVKHLLTPLYLEV